VIGHERHHGSVDLTGVDLTAIAAEAELELVTAVSVEQSEPAPDDVLGY
jgi:hypothetical protein